MKLIKQFVFLFLLFLNILCFGKSQQSLEDSLKFIEKIYLHTDRSTYYLGEDIWFKAYLIDALDHSLTNHTQNLHVELISPSSKIISSRIIRLDNGLGNGDFRLPDNIISGRYKLRAYTNYMRNFGDQLFFTKEINVLNPNDKQNGISDTIKYVESKIRINFFPEGGSLVDNVSSIVAFKAENNLGKGCDVTGKIYSSSGDLITKFRSTHLGMGLFFLRPIPGLSYYSIFKGADSTDVKVELPKSLSTGVTFCVLKNQNNELLFTTKTNPKTLSLVAENNLLLTISRRTEVIKTIRFKINYPVTEFVIPTDDLPDGILILTLSTQNLPLSERLVYIQREAPIQVQIESDKHFYSKRERVVLKLSLPRDSASEREGNVSLAVVNKSFTENTSPFPRTISSWFLLESEVRGSVENPSYYFDPANTERLKDLDLLLCTQGWRDFAWKYDTIYFPPENGFTISGRLRRYYANKAIEGARVTIGIFGSRSQLLETVPVDSNGTFKLSGIDFIGEAGLIVTGIGKKDRMQGELHLDSVFHVPPKVSDSLYPLSKFVEMEWRSLQTYYKINEATKKKYKLSDTINPGEVNITAERHKDPQAVKNERSRVMYDKPDNEVVVTKQMLGYRYPIEILRGRVPGVAVFGQYPYYRIEIRGPSPTLIGEGRPLVLIDGNPATFDDLILMPISNLDRIDILKYSSSIYGVMGGNGVINLITKAGGGLDYVPEKYAINKKIFGYNTSRIFYSPQHLSDSNSAFQPDLRSTLLWEPNIYLKGNNEVSLNYYNGDNSSYIRIISEGITTTGIPVTGTAEYEIR